MDYGEEMSTGTNVSDAVTSCDVIHFPCCNLMLFVKYMYSALW